MVNLVEFSKDACPHDIEMVHVGLPRRLRAISVESSRAFVVVSFSLARLEALTRAEIEVARLATSGHSNATIARMRGTAVPTVAAQMAGLLRKLGLGSRLGLSTVPELGA